MRIGREMDPKTADAVEEDGENGRKPRTVLPAQAGINGGWLIGDRPASTAIDPDFRQGRGAKRSKSSLVGTTEFRFF